MLQDIWHQGLILGAGLMQNRARSILSLLWGGCGPSGFTRFSFNPEKSCGNFMGQGSLHRMMDTGWEWVPLGEF